MQEVFNVYSLHFDYRVTVDNARKANKGVMHDAVTDSKVHPTHGKSTLKSMTKVSETDK